MKKAICLLLTLFFIAISYREADAQLREGIKAFKKREFDKAVSHLSEVLKNNPKDDTALIFLGMSYLIKGNHNEAEKIFNEVISMDLKPYLLADIVVGDT